jgi:site-specific DNA-methyltransferase (adenine-specific)/adenine-specific DNA-methyltransferase
VKDPVRKKIIELLKKGEDIPIEFQEDIFPTAKKEYELKYVGKERKESILNNTMSVPFQPVKYFGKSKKGEWANKLIFGDNLQILKHLIKLKEAGKLKNADGTDGVRLVYIDPPFATKQDFKGNQDQKAYSDRIAGTEFIEFLRQRLILLKEVLADNGSIYVHLDWKKSHYIKIIMDEIFGENNFKNEVVWYYGERQMPGINKYNNKHEYILFYTSSNKWKFNMQFKPYSNEYIKTFFNKEDKNGKYQLTDAGKGKPRYKRYLEDAQGVAMDTVWDDVKMIGSISLSKERVDYPTQKPESLIGRIIKTSSEKGDLILDIFAGSGTTGAVAEKLGRRWIMCDCGKLAIYTTQKRLLNLREEIGNKGKEIKPKPFTVYNAGLYNDKDLMEHMQGEEYKSFVLELFGCQEKEHKIKGLEMQGTLNNYSVLVFNQKQYLTEEFVDELHGVVGNSIKSKMFIVAPVGVVDFNQDYIDKGKVSYVILRIPNSIIDYIRKKKFTRLEQPRTANDVNQTIDSVGFDFVYPPKVKAKYFSRNKKNVIKIDSFEPVQIGTKVVEFQDPKSEAIAMVMLDFNYDGDTFSLDKCVFGDEIVKNKFEIEMEGNIGKNVMIIYVDIFGNELREIKSKKDFKKK